LALLGVLGMGIFYLLPAVAEALALLGVRAWEMVIRADPVARLKKDVAAHQQQIQALEERIADADVAVADLERTLGDAKGKLGQGRMANWQAQLDLVSRAGKELVILRDEEIRKHEDFKLVVQQAEAEHKLGAAFRKAMAAFAFAQKSGPESLGSGVALDEVHTQLARSQARIAVVLSRPNMQALKERNPS
jgi:chromosome segregation ATPase